MSLGTLFPAHTNTGTHSQRVLRSTTTHTCLTYTSRDMLVLSVCRSTPPDLSGRIPAQRSTQTHARYTTSCLITPAVIKQTQQRLTPPRRLLAQKHTLTHPQTHLAMSQRWTHPGDTLRHIGSTHAYAGAHTNPHRVITHRCSHPRKSTDTPLPSGHRHSSSPSHPRCLFHKESKQQRSLHTRGSQTHTQETHVSKTCSHAHRSRTRAQGTQMSGL